MSPKKKHVDPKVMQLRRSIVDKFKFDESNPHPELKKGKSKQKRISTRREKRKLAKQVKKARRIAYATKQPLENLYAEILHVKGARTIVKNEQTIEEQKEKQIQVKQKKAEERKEMRLQEMRRLMEEDDKEIKMFAKRLKLNKRKGSSLPKSFIDEGLNYLLELCDTTKRQKVIENEGSDNEDDSFNDDQPKSDSDEEISKPQNVRQTASDGQSSHKRVRFADEKNEFDDDEDEIVSDDEMQESEAESDESDEDDQEITEDIYGRLKDRKGNVVKQISKPQDLSQGNSSLKSIGQRETLTKLFKSLINRLSEATVQSSASKIQELYQSHSRNDIKEIFTDTIFQSCIRAERVPDRLLLEQSLLLALIHSKLSSEITSYFIERLAIKLKSLRLEFPENETDDKSLDNVSVMFAHLFSLKVIQSKLCFDVVNFFLQTFKEKDIELILLFLQTVGNALRKDNVIRFKSLFDEIHLKSTSTNVSSLANQSRVKFLLESLQLLKNNDVHKVSNYDPTMIEHFLKMLRGMMSGKALESPLSMSLQDLWSASTTGRWWIVGSAVFDTSYSHKSSLTTASGTDPSIKMQFSDALLNLAKRNRMNTDLRRNIFCIIMSSEDYLDAFEKLTKLSLKDQQEREIIHIALHCCLKEKSFNPFYSYLVQRFCSDQPRFVLTTQFAIWDKFKTINEISKTEMENLALFLSHLMANKVLSLTVLKAVDFGQIDESVQSFLTVLFTRFLLDTSEENLRTIFANCLVKKKFQSFLEGVKIFLHHIFLKRVAREKDRLELNKRISMIDKFFYYSLENSLL